MFRGFGSKEGQHFQRFMLVFQRLKPEAFDQLHDEVFKQWVEAEADFVVIMKTDYWDAVKMMDEWYIAVWQGVLVDPTVAKELGVTPKIAQYIFALEAWRTRYNLDSYSIPEFVMSLMMKWGKEPESRDRRELQLRLAPSPAPTPEQPVGKKPTPPAFTEMSEERYLARVDEYIQEVKEWRKRKLYLPRRERLRAKYACKNNPLHYEWAVFYQCFEKSPYDICKMYEERAPTEESEVLSYIKRTLKVCLFAPRRGKAGRTKVNDAVLQKL